MNASAGGDVLGGMSTVAASDGIAGLSGLTLDTVGTYAQLVVSSEGLSSTTTGAIRVIPLAATKLILTSEPPAVITAGAGFGFDIEAEDPFGNLATSFDGTMTVAFSANPDAATLGGPITATAQSGLASFAGLAVGQAASGYALQITSGSLNGATTSASL